MAFAFFPVPVRDDGQAAAALNSFLQSHRVLHVERQWIADGDNSYWAFCVDYWERTDGGRPPSAGRRGKDRIDYREVLPPEQFVVFAKLRDWRRQMAKDESVPPYTIFDNEQLAQMVKSRVSTKAALSEIPGVGPARIDKDGDRVVQVLVASWGSTDEANR